MIHWSRGFARSRDKLKLYISNTIVPMATKLDRMVTYHEELPPIKLHERLIKWYCEITWQTKKLYLYYHNTYGYQTWQPGDIPWKTPTLKGAWSLNHVVLWGHVTYRGRSHGILNGRARWRNFGPFFQNCIIIINSYTGLMSFCSSYIKDTFPRRNNH